MSKKGGKKGVGSRFHWVRKAKAVGSFLHPVFAMLAKGGKGDILNLSQD